jgi:hypothetical protein
LTAWYYHSNIKVRLPPPEGGELRQRLWLLTLNIIPKLKEVVKMDCPCPRCNNIDVELNSTGGDYTNEFEFEEIEEPKSIYDRLAKLSDELKAYGVPAKFINELNDICDKIDEIDREIVRLQEVTPTRWVELGELSKRLF